MNISELNQALHTIADEVTDDSGTRLASVVRRAQVARRSRVAGILVTTCAAVAAFVFLPDWHDTDAPDQGPAASRMVGSLATMKDGDLLVYTDAGGVRLLGAKAGDRGDPSISLTVTPKNGNLGWTQPCQTPSVKGLTYHLSVNGKPVPSAALDSLRYTGTSQISQPNTTCDKPSPPLQVERSLSLNPTGNEVAWRAFDVSPQEPATFTLSVTASDDADGRHALAHASLRLGVFALPFHPVHTHGMWLARHIVDPPGARGAFVLARHRLVTVRPGKTQLTVPVDVSDGEVYVRSFAIHGERAGVRMSPGADNPREIDTVKRSWSVAKYLHAGPATIRAGVARVPAGSQRRVMMLVYLRYQ